MGTIPCQLKKRNCQGFIINLKKKKKIELKIRKDYLRIIFSF